jgi:hypothetical protein
MGLLFLLCIVGFVLIYGCGLIGKSIGNAIFNTEESAKYIDKSVTINHNYHNHVHKHQNLTVIDEETHKKALDKFNLN